MYIITLVPRWLLCSEIENMNIVWNLNPWKPFFFFFPQNKKIDISIVLLQHPSLVNGDFTLLSSHYSTMKYTKHLRKINILNIQKKKRREGRRGRGWDSPHLFCAAWLCPDLELLVSSTADLWQWHMSCVGEDWEEEAEETEGVILVCRPVGVRVRPRVRGWACLAQIIDCTASTHVSVETPERVGGVHVLHH